MPRHFAVLILTATFALGAAGPATGATRSCGKTRVGDGLALDVEAKRVRCKKAKRIDKAFFKRDGTVEHGGPANYQRYWTLSAFPGWRCGTGAGGGGCRKGKRYTSFQVVAE